MARIRPVTITGEAELLRNMRGYLAQVATKRERQRILLAGGRIIRNAAKKKVQKSKAPHYYYPRKGNSGRIKILPGNLANSIYMFRNSDGAVSIGPRVLRPIAGKATEIGQSPKQSSGYYASMLYGKAAEFRRRITDSALSQRLSQVNNAMEKAYQRIHRQWKKKYNL